MVIAVCIYDVFCQSLKCFSALCRHQRKSRCENLGSILVSHKV